MPPLALSVVVRELEVVARRKVGLEGVGGRLRGAGTAQFDIDEGTTDLVLEAIDYDRPHRTPALLRGACCVLASRATTSPHHP